jgi:hypothetical protein
MKTRNELVSSGRASPHHVMPQSGWVSYWIEKGEDDLAAIIGLFRLRYEQLKPKFPHKQEQKIEEEVSHFDDYTYGWDA